MRDAMPGFGLTDRLWRVHMLPQVTLPPDEAQTMTDKLYRDSMFLCSKVGCCGTLEANHVRSNPFDAGPHNAVWVIAVGTECT